MSFFINVARSRRAFCEETIFNMEIISLKTLCTPTTVLEIVLVSYHISFFESPQAVYASNNVFEI